VRSGGELWKSLKKSANEKTEEETNNKPNKQHPKGTWDN
jgi:hypothetical protein